MADSLRVADNRKGLKHNIVHHNSPPKQCLVASIPKHYSQKAFRRIVDMNQNILGMGTVSEIGLLILKIAALEAVRRFSKAHCPILWRSLQALQLVCVPPFKWIGKWGIFRGFLKCMQALSRPLLVLSITTLWEGSDDAEETSASPGASQPSTDLQSDSSANLTPGSRSAGEGSQIQAPEDWMLQLYSELEKEGMSLPERISEDELRRFYHTAHGDFARFLSAVKKTIKWRQNFKFLSVQELEDWSEMVFWHGYDTKGHPCLFIRVAPACSIVVSEKRSCLPEVVVSQIEYGIRNLVPQNNPLVTVLMDCEGLTPFRFPVQMMRSCAILLQDHYPNRLAALFVVRLPPIARVVAQTLFQVLRPGTRKKLRILGDDYEKVLSEHLQSLPLLFRGDCSCPKCLKVTSKEDSSKVVCEENNVLEPSRELVDKDLLPLLSGDIEFVKCDRVLKTMVIGLLVLLLCIVYAVGFHSMEGLRLYRRGSW